MKLLKIPLYKQKTKYTCAAAALRMVLAYFKIEKGEEEIARAIGASRRSGASPESVVNFFKRRGFKLIVKDNARFEDIEEAFKEGYIIIAGYRHPNRDGHFGVVMGLGKEHIFLRDPNPHTGEIVSYKKSYFMDLWRRGFRYNKEKRWFLGVKKKR